MGIPEDAASTVRRLFNVWQARLARNQKRSLYYGGEQAFKDLNIALPPQLRNARFVLGWATQAVRKPAMRAQFQGLRVPGSEDPFELKSLLAQNRFGLEFAEATVDANKHGVSFVTVTGGAAGEPGVQIQAHSAESAAALWDQRRRCVEAGLTIGEVDKDGNPTEFTVYLSDRVLTCTKDNGSWSTDVQPTRIGRAPMVAVPHDPQLNRPFGRSRITRPVMALTDMAVRAYVRMEGNAEFYSAPQIAAMGVDPEAFAGMGGDQKFKLAMDRLIALSKDADGDVPKLEQLAQASMQPHSDMLRTIGSAFSGETGIPLSALGIVHDQPSSAEAIRAAEHDLLVDVTYQNEYVLSPAIADIARLAVMVRDGLDEPPAEAWGLSAQFADPEFRSTSANADAYVKLVGANPDLATSDVLLETVFTPEQVARLQAASRQKSSSSLLDRVLTSASTEGPAAAPSATDSEAAAADVALKKAQALKAQFDALGSAVRSAVDPEDAARLVDLPGIKFTGAVPVSLRLPEQDADALED